LRQPLRLPPEPRSIQICLSCKPCSPCPPSPPDAEKRQPQARRIPVFLHAANTHKPHNQAILRT
jgi:hypothetical protein